MKTLLLTIGISLILVGCGQSTVDSCLNSFASSLGTLTAQQLTDYNNQGCCEYQGGVSFINTCSGGLICKDGSDSSCHK